MSWSWRSVAQRITLADLLPLLNRSMKALENTLRRQEVRNTLLSDPGLRITGGSGAATAETQNGFHYVAGGIIGTVAASTNMPALAGTVANGDYGLFVWTVDSQATVSQSVLVTASSLAGLTFPEPHPDKAIVGALLVNPTGTGNFVGGTTNIDDGTVAPNAVFFDGNDLGGT